MLAITEHAEGTLSGVSREALLAQRAQIEAMRASLGDSLVLLHGVELNIGRDGELDYDAEFRSSFDWCLASVHDHFELDRAAQTRRDRHRDARPVGAHDRTPLRAHDRRPPADRPRSRRGLRRGRGDRHRARGERVAAAPRPVGRRAAPRAERDVTFVLTSDAHLARELDRVEFAARNAERAWTPRERVANTWPAERLAAWAQQRRSP